MSHQATKSAGPDRLIQPDPLLTTREAARQVGVSLSTVQLWIEAGRLRAARTLGGHRRIRQSDVTMLRAQMGVTSPADVGREAAELLALARALVSALPAGPAVTEALKCHTAEQVSAVIAARELAMSIIRRAAQ